MEAWKNTILLSIRQDIADIISLQARISEIYPSNKIPSWIYPTRTCPRIDHENSDDKYSTHLEQLLDRIYIVVNLFMVHLDKAAPNSKQKNVFKPPNLSLARCFENVWRKISQSKEIVRNNAEQNTQEGIVRENADNGICSSCNLAFENIKAITNYLEENISDSTAKITKEILRLNMVEATDESSMGKLCEAIKQDVFGLLAKNAGLNVDKREYAEKLDNMRISEESYIKTIKDKDNEILQLVELHKTSEMKYEVIQTDQRNVLSTLDQLKVENLKLENDNFKFKSDIEELKCDREIYRSENENLNVEIKKTKEEILSMKRDYCNQMKLVVEAVGKQEGELRGFNELINQYEKESKDSVELYLKKIKNMEELVVDIIKTQKFRKTANNCEENLVVKGDPLDDMLKQIEMNQQNMKRLEEENFRLKKTVDKLRLMNGKLID